MTDPDSAPAEPRVILVDEQDRQTGTMAKLAAHQGGGFLHRAFSVFVFNSAGQMLLQRRSKHKYHFGGLWTNACCSHPAPGQQIAAAARTRLNEEFGFDANLVEAFSFIYRAEDPASRLTEHEYDHVLIGRFDGQPRPNPEEIEDWAWISATELLDDLRRLPDRYTPWFHIALQRVLLEV